MDPATTSATCRARVGDALDLLHRALYPYIAREMRAVYGDRWEQEARSVLHDRPPDVWDTSDLLTLLYTQFHPVFRAIGHEGRSRVSLLREIRKKWAHQGVLSLDETRRTLETTILLLRAIGAEREAERLQPHVLDLMRTELADRGLPSPADTPSPDDEPPGTPVPPVRTRWRAGLQRLQAWWQRPPSEPLEMRQALLDAIERAAEPYRLQFHFNRLIVHILTPDEARQRLYEAALEGQREPFASAVLRRLADARIPVSGALHVAWKFHRTPPRRLAAALERDGVHVVFDRRRVEGTATLSVVRGRTEREHYVIRAGTTTLGRQAEVTDERGRIVWRNTIAFLDYEDERLREDEREIHATVSRVHARIEYDEDDGIFRLYDAQSTCGTSVVRDGFLMPFQVRQRPVPLQDGDLIYLGKACLRFHLGRPARRDGARSARRGRRRQR